MEKNNWYQNPIELDKKLHFLVSLCLVLFFFFLIQNLLLSIIISFLIGLLKEIYDKYFGSGFCWKDILADILGILIGIGLILLL